MKNVDMTVKGDKLTITVDLTERHGLSNTGKTTVVASTGGNQQIGDTGVYLGLNAYTKDK